MDLDHQIVGEPAGTPTSFFNFPPVVGFEGLSVLIKRAVSTIQADRCRKPNTVPPACTPPGSKNPLWITADVIQWLRQFQETRKPAETPAAVAPSTQPKRRRGRPAKAEALARQAAARAQFLRDSKMDEEGCEK